MSTTREASPVADSTLLELAAAQVPSYRIQNYADKQSDYCACVFVINEGERVRAQLEKMCPLAGEVDIIIADGGSTDGSLGDERMRDYCINTVLTKTGPGRLSAQMRMAFDYCLRRGYAGVITIDGNNKDDPSAIPKFVRALRNGMDHVQGSRFISGGVSRNLPLSRFLGVRFLHAPLISLSSGFRYTDTTNGFRAYSAKFLSDPRLKLFRDVFSDYELHYYLAIQAPRLGFKVCELPVTRVYPDKGKIPTKISFLKGNSKVLKTLFKACLHHYDP